MDVTVCICTRDRPGYLQDCLRGLRRQTVGDAFDIVVVDSASRRFNAARLARIIACVPNARLVRVEEPGISLARNVGAQAARSSYIAYIDDDAIPAPDWIERITAAIAETDLPTALIGGRIMPRWEAPLPSWWPRQLRGTLSIIEHVGWGEYRTPALPSGLEPYGANIVVHVPTCWQWAASGEIAAATAERCFRTRRCRSPGACRMPGTRFAMTHESSLNTRYRHRV